MSKMICIILLLLSDAGYAQYFKSIPIHFPIENGVISSKYGWRISPFIKKRRFHVGLDIVAPLGTPIFAPADGIVIKVGKRKLLGNFIILAHGKYVKTKYGHLKKIIVKPKQKVIQGDIIGLVGKTGRTTGAHLHYEILINNQNVDPLKFILNP